MIVQKLMKLAVFGVASFMTAPLWVLERVSRRLAGRDVWFEGQSELLSLVPGKPGRFMRNAYYAALLDECPRDVCLQFGSQFASSKVRVGKNVYLGLHSKVGMVDIGDHTIISDDVQLLSGARQHIPAGLHHSIVAEAVNRERIVVGKKCWIGTKAVVMASIGDNCVIGAGSIVTRLIPANSIAVGVPARVIRKLDGPSVAKNISGNDPLSEFDFVV